MSNIEGRDYMEDIIAELIQIEDKAKGYMNESENTRHEISAAARKKLDEFKRAMEAQTRQKARHMRENAAMSTRAALERFTREGDERLQQLEADFAANRACWHSEILNRVLNG